MKRLLFLVALATAVTGAAADLPTAITLSNGFVMKDCTIVRWDADTILVKYVGGTVPVRLDNIDPEQRAVIISHQAAALKHQREADKKETRTLAKEEHTAEVHERRAAERQVEAAHKAAAIQEGLEQHHLVVGMTMEQVHLIFGTPSRATSYTSTHLEDAWIYDGRGKDARGVPCNLQVRFKNGIVTGWGNIFHQ